MSKEQDNKAIVGRWFTEFWGNAWNPAIVDELCTADILLQYSLHAPRRGRADVKAFMTEFREAFPDLSVTGAADFVCEGDYVVGRWEGWGTHTGPAYCDTDRLHPPQWWAHVVGAIRVHPHKHYANYPPQKDRGFARGGHVAVDCQFKIN